MPPSIRQAAHLLVQEGPTARELGPELLPEQLLESLTGVAFLLGHSNTLADGESLDTMSTAVAELILRRFPAFRLPEISLALRRGASGEWPQPNTLLLPNLPNITYWLTCYQQQVRSVALAELDKANQPVALLPAADPAAQYPERVAEWVATLVQRRPLRWELLDPGNVVYSWLAKVGAFRGYLTTERHARMLRTVCWQLCQEPVSSRDTARRRREFREQARRGQLEGVHAAALTNACRKFLLREWLHAQASRGVVEVLTWLEDLYDNAA